MEEIIKIIMDMFQGSEISNYFNTLFANPLKIVLAVIDIIIVLLILLNIYRVLKNTRAIKLIKGIIVLVIANWLSSVFSLNILHSLLGFITNYGILLVIVVFQPELRRALEQVGNTSFRKWFEVEDQKEVTCINEVVKAAVAMSKTKVGMLVVFERESSLGEIINNGVSLNSDVSAELLVNIFVKDTPLHDGAVVIKNNKIASAACILPLTDKDSLDRIFGTRHRAAIGVSESTDSVVVVVSEETGNISICENGNIYKINGGENLEKELNKRLNKSTSKTKKPYIVNKIMEKK